MKLENGCWYRRRDGEVVQAQRQLNLNGGFCFIAADEWYTEDGTFWSHHKPDRRDLIEKMETVDAASLSGFAPKIAQECRNDSIKIANIDNPDDATDAGRQVTRATEIAAKAAELVGGDRDRQHGAKEDNFRRIATMWNAWLATRKAPAAPLDAHDVGIMMVLMKAARTQSGALNIDDYVDGAGYMACAGEVAQQASTEREQTI